MESSLIKNILPIEKIRFFHTYRLGLLIYGIIIATRSESYGEIGCGYGYPLVLAGMALRDNCKLKYQLWGIDIKPNRIKITTELLKKNDIKGEIMNEDAYTFKPRKTDILFIDIWSKGNQAMIDKFSTFVNRCIILHDVNEKNSLKFPDGWNVIYILESNVCIAYNNK